MDPNQAVDWICANSGLAKGLLAWGAAAIPAGALTYFPKYWNKIPAPGQRLLHAVALNFVHALANPRVAPAPPP